MQTRFSSGRIRSRHGFGTERTRFYVGCVVLVATLTALTVRPATADQSLTVIPVAGVPDNVDPARATDCQKAPNAMRRVIVHLGSRAQGRCLSQSLKDVRDSEGQVRATLGNLDNAGDRYPWAGYRQAGQWAIHRRSR